MFWLDFSTHFSAQEIIVKKGNLRGKTHYKKFKMNEEVDSFLHEWESKQFAPDLKILNECPPLIVYQDGKLSAATLK